MIDSSVLVAAFYRQHVHFEASQHLLRQLPTKQRVATLHSMAETYAAITRLPLQPRPSPDAAQLYLRSLSAHIRWLPLSQEVYGNALTRVAALQLPGAKIYDAIILEAALEAGHKRIYTWNIKDFTLLAQGEPMEVLKPGQHIAG